MEWVCECISTPGLLAAEPIELTPADIMNSVEQKKCSNCGESFTCGSKRVDENCWCAQLPPVPLVANKGQDCFCPKCLLGAIPKFQCAATIAEGVLPAAIEAELTPSNSLVEGEDYYLEGEALVFTALYHLRRGYCCENNCRHCPYRKS